MLAMSSWGFQYIRPRVETDNQKFQVILLQQVQRLTRLKYPITYLTCLMEIKEIMRSKLICSRLTFESSQHQISLSCTVSLLSKWNIHLLKWILLSSESFQGSSLSFTLFNSRKLALIGFPHWYLLSLPSSLFSPTFCLLLSLKSQPYFKSQSSLCQDIQAIKQYTLQ